MRTLNPLPKYYIIETTNKCNYSCNICPNSIRTAEDPIGCMSIELYERILNQIRDYAEVVQLYWMGEPLLNSEIFSFIRLCKERTKAKVIISTNGSLISDDVIQKLKYSGLDELVISVDACDSQTIYESIRRGGDLSQLNANIRKMLHNKGAIHIILRFIDMYVNHSELQGFLRKWSDYDCDLEISCLYTWANQMPSLNLASNNLSPVLKKTRAPCADLWNKLSIHWNGVVSACCFDYNNRLFLGDCNNKSLFDIWNDDLICELRDMHLAEQYKMIPLCRHCDAWAEKDEYIEMYHLGSL